MIIIPKTKKTFAIGVDVGKAAESTAVAVVQITNPVGWDPCADCPKDKLEFQVRFLKRFPPNTTYLEVGKLLAEQLGARELTDKIEITPRKTVRSVDLYVGFVIDQTAVGPPVVNFMEQTVKRPSTRVVLTDSHAGGYSPDGFYRVPKQALIGDLLETGRLKIAQDLPDVRALTDELLNYRSRKTSTSATMTDTWREQPSDDLVFAVALAVWRLRQHDFSYEFF
jgi:hypothetical protein